LSLTNFSDPPTQRSAGILRGLRGGDKDRHGDQSTVTPIAPESAGDSRSVYPCTVHHTGRLGGLYTLYAENQQARTEWKQKLQEALGLRKVVQESNKVFEIETLSADTFLVPSMMAAGVSSPSWNHENSFTGKVTCSVPFSALSHFLGLFLFLLINNVN
jgi:RHO1 GDP-GTP exchange protein 1/2